eukprot:scaffold10191_cov283-Chaetoceros_neogracile.AAC.8
MALEASAKFEVVIVDEAAQSVESASLVALQVGNSQAILVGDPQQQLPATIFSMSARKKPMDYLQGTPLASPHGEINDGK